MEAEFFVTFWLRNESLDSAMAVRLVITQHRLMQVQVRGLVGHTHTDVTHTYRRAHTRAHAQLGSPDNL